VQIVECEAFEQVFGRFAAGLEARGLHGSITLHEPREPAPLPVQEHVIVCRARLRGRRVRHERAAYRWIADETAIAHVLRDGEHWCRSLGGGARQTLVRTGAAEVSVGHEDAVAEQLVADAAQDLGATCWSVGVRGFRGIGFQPPSGVCLVAGSSQLDWRAAVEAFAGFLREHAEWLEYAYVMRGWLPGVLLGGHLSHDLPERAGAEPRGAGWTSLRSRTSSSRTRSVSSCWVLATWSGCPPTRPAGAGSRPAIARSCGMRMTTRGSRPRSSRSNGSSTRTTAPCRRSSPTHGASSPRSSTPRALAPFGFDDVG
jgi:hypothetical protein